MRKFILITALLTGVFSCFLPLQAKPVDKATAAQMAARVLNKAGNHPPARLSPKDNRLRINLKQNLYDFHASVEVLFSTFYISIIFPKPS